MDRRLNVVLLAALLASCWGSSVFGATAQSVEDFMKLKSKWENLVGSKFFLEGRFSGGTETIFGLVGCPLECRMKEPVPKFESRRDVLEVNVELARDERTMGLYFKVDSIRRLEPDDRVFAKRRTALPLNDPDAWYKLADWAIARGEHYKDSELIAGGRACRVQAVAIERSDRTRRTPELLEDLSRRSIALTGDESLRLMILHEAWQIRWETSRTKLTADEMLGFSQSLERALPFGTERLTAALDVSQQYWKSPVKEYDLNESNSAAPDAEKQGRRRKLHRAFYAEVVRGALAKKMAADGANGKEIAVLVDELIPEFSDIAADYRRRHNEYRFARVEKMTWGELSAFRKELEQLDRPADSRQVFDKWFLNQEKALKQRGAVGLIELAGLYETLPELEPRKFKAVDFLLEADKLVGGLPDVGQRLTRYGYERVDGRWLTQQQAAVERNTPTAIAMREGRVIEGMTAEQVRKSLGQPTGITRFLTAKVVREYWHYADAKVSVRLDRPAQRAESVVVSVTVLAK